MSPVKAGMICKILRVRTLQQVQDKCASDKNMLYDTYEIPVATPTCHHGLTRTLLRVTPSFQSKSDEK